MKPLTYFVIGVVLAALLLLTLAGCNAVEGIGKDISYVGSMRAPIAQAEK